jgi:hypothetical protein
MARWQIWSLGVPIADPENPLVNWEYDDQNPAKLDEPEFTFDHVLAFVGALNAELETPPTSWDTGYWFSWMSDSFYRPAPE